MIKQEPKLEIKSYSNIRAQDMLSIARKYIDFTKWKDNFEIVIEKEVKEKDDSISK